MKNTRAILVFAALITALPAFTARAKDAPVTADDLLKRFEAALKAKDKPALLALYRWEGVSAEMKQMQEMTIDMMFSQQAKSVKLGPLPAGFQAEAVRDGIRYYPNVTVVGMIAIEVPSAVGNAQVPYGKTENAFYLSNVLQEKLAGPAIKSKNLMLIISISAAPEQLTSFEGTYVYVNGGKEFRKEIKKEFPGEPGKRPGSTTSHSQNESFWGDYIKSCTVRKTSAAGALQVEVLADGTKVFESERETTDKPIEYEAKF